MTDGIEQWLDETHGTRAELLRHFLPRFFDSDLLASSSSGGGWMRVAGSALAILASSWILLGYVLLLKYGKLAELRVSPERIASEVRSDLASLTWMGCWLRSYGNPCIQRYGITSRSRVCRSVHGIFSRPNSLPCWPR
jgi:hypothetical protein